MHIDDTPDDNLDHDNAADHTGNPDARPDATIPATAPASTGNVGDKSGIAQAVREIDHPGVTVSGVQTAIDNGELETTEHPETGHTIVSISAIRRLFGVFVDMLEGTEHQVQPLNTGNPDNDSVLDPDYIPENAEGGSDRTGIQKAVPGSDPTLNPLPGNENSTITSQDIATGALQAQADGASSSEASDASEAVSKATPNDEGDLVDDSGNVVLGNDASSVGSQVRNDQVKDDGEVVPGEGNASASSATSDTSSTDGSASSAGSGSEDDAALDPATSTSPGFKVGDTDPGTGRTVTAVDDEGVITATAAAADTSSSTDGASTAS